MIRQAPCRLLRSAPLSLRATPARRFLSTAPPAKKSRSWKNKATRLGLAVGVVYYYNTSTLFAEEPPFAVPPPSSPSDETSLPTLESIKADHQRPPPSPESIPAESFEEQDQEASQEGAYNEETGEINWDCPCLGGMAHGPCGEQFRAAFGCFVHSTEEPKGMDCIDNFKTMQDCFRSHPDVYGSELEEGEEDDNDNDTPPLDQDALTPTPPPTSTPAPLTDQIPTTATSAAPPEPQTISPPSLHPSAPAQATSDTERARAAKQQVESEHGASTSEGDDRELVPKAAHDATSAVGGR